MAQRHEWVDLRYAPGRQVTRQASDEQDADRRNQIGDGIHGGQVIKE